jgi:hypothetical protein
MFLKISNLSTASISSWERRLCKCYFSSSFTADAFAWRCGIGCLHSCVLFEFELREYEAADSLLSISILLPFIFLTGSSHISLLYITYHCFILYIIFISLNTTYIGSPHSKFSLHSRTSFPYDYYISTKSARPVSEGYSPAICALRGPLHIRARTKHIKETARNEVSEWQAVSTFS